MLQPALCHCLKWAKAYRDRFRHFWRNGKFLPTQARSIPKANALFHYPICVFSISHFTGKQNIIQNAKRQAKVQPGTRAINPRPILKSGFFHLWFFQFTFTGNDNLNLLLKDRPVDNLPEPARRQHRTAIRRLPGFSTPDLRLVAGICHYFNWNSTLSFWFRMAISDCGSFPKRPLTNVLSSVAIFAVLIRDCLTIQLLRLGEINTSNGSCHWVCEVIKQTVTSRLVSARITAGLSLLPLKFVKGNVMSKTSPFAIINFF